MGSAEDHGAPPDLETCRSDDAAFFELSLDHLCVAGFDGYWKRLNPAWSRTLGWTAQEMMSRPIVEFAHPEDREALLAARARLIDGQPLLTLTNRYRCKDGSYRWFEWKSIADPDRQVVYAIARDVTEHLEAQHALRAMAEAQQQLERRLVLADRMASVGTLAAGVAHEINNPLAYIATNLDLLSEEFRGLERGPFSSRIADWAEMVRDAREGCDRIRKIVRGLKTFSRAEEERRAVIDVRPVLELAINMAFNEIRHRARLVKDYGEIPPVEADDSRLGQVFINLLVNAAQAIPEGDTEGNEIRVVTSTDASGCAIVEVRDTGPGIPPAVLGRLFDPFFTTKPVGVGTGLGLSICHNILTSMGGQIVGANREGGRGATFRVVLPAATNRPAPTRAPTPSPAPAGQRVARVLVVDDERSIGSTLQRMLRNHRVTHVTSAKEALDLLATDAAFDVILSDLMMPGMSGMELYEQLVHLRPRAAERMIFMTGGAFTPAATEFLDRVPNDRIEKPFEPAIVRAMVERFAR